MTKYDKIQKDEYDELENYVNEDIETINKTKLKKNKNQLTNELDYEYYTKLLKKKLIEKTLTMERIIKKWDKNYDDFTSN